MSGSPAAGSRRLYWAIGVIALLVVLAIAYAATRKSQHADNNAVANGTSTGTAYDTTTGNTEPANAQPGALDTGAANGPPPTAAAAADTNGRAGGTQASTGAVGQGGTQPH